ncbi:MAG: hypothetical protein H6868_04990 [Rhodospirillales bacterium]|nr:hypothetical protein [Rhodospirillales bacterium]
MATAPTTEETTLESGFWHKVAVGARGAFDGAVAEVIATPGYIADLVDVGSEWAFDYSLYEGSAGKGIADGVRSAADAVGMDVKILNATEASIYGGAKITGEALTYVTGAAGLAKGGAKLAAKAATRGVADNVATLAKKEIRKGGDDVAAQVKNIHRNPGIPDADKNLISGRLLDKAQGKGKLTAEGVEGLENSRVVTQTTRTAASSALIAQENASRLTKAGSATKEAFKSAVTLPKDHVLATTTLVAAKEGLVYNEEVRDGSADALRQQAAENKQEGDYITGAAMEGAANLLETDKAAAHRMSAGSGNGIHAGGPSSAGADGGMLDSLGDGISNLFNYAGLPGVVPWVKEAGHFLKTEVPQFFMEHPDIGKWVAFGVALLASDRILNMLPGSDTMIGKILVFAGTIAASLGAMGFAKESLETAHKESLNPANRVHESGKSLRERAAVENDQTPDNRIEMKPAEVLVYN